MMNYAFSSILFLCLSILSWAGETPAETPEPFQSRSLNVAKVRYAEALADADKEYRRKTESAKASYLRVLEPALKQAQRRKDTDEAGKIAAEKTKLDGNTTNLIDDGISQRVIGKWVCQYKFGKMTEKEADIFFMEGNFFRRSRHDKRQYICTSQSGPRCLWSVTNKSIRAVAYWGTKAKNPKFDYTFTFSKNGTLIGRPNPDSEEKAVIYAKRE